MYNSERCAGDELKKRGVESTDFRILGYNGPGVASDKELVFITERVIL